MMDFLWRHRSIHFKHGAIAGASGLALLPFVAGPRTALIAAGIWAAAVLLLAKLDPWLYPHLVFAAKKRSRQ